MSLPHLHSSVSAREAKPSAPAPLGSTGSSATKKRSELFPHNPLKSLDSDERIQGNPRESNPDKRALSSRKGDEPRKS
jgi:hypothetical protein